MIQPNRLAESARHGQSSVIHETGLFQCLVVSVDDSRREALAWAARDGGWQTLSCGDAEAALERVRRTLLQLAIVDLTASNGTEPPRFRELVEYLACCAGRVLVVACGDEGNARQEVWARHLGVWMYLPGAADGVELAALCGEARLIAKRLAAHEIESRSGDLSVARPN
jgi:hypothetical protein